MKKEKELRQTLKSYEQKVNEGGNPSEIFWSLFSIAQIQEALQEDAKIIEKSYLKAFAFDSKRAEPLHHLAKFYQNQRRFPLSYALAKYALELPRPDESLPMLASVYDYSLQVVYATSCHAMRLFKEAKKYYLKLLEKKDLPQEIQELVQFNLNTVEKQLP